MEEYTSIMLNKIHTSIPAKIISFDPEKMEASVQSLARVKVGNVEIEPQEIEKCPVCFLNDSTFAIRHPLKQGDLVWLGFSEVSLENILDTKNPTSVISKNKFDITDAVVVGTIDGTNDRMPSTNANDLLILNKKTGHKIIFKEDGSLETTVEIINAPSCTSLNAPNAVITCKKVIASDDVTGGGISLKNHTHSYNPGPGSPTPTTKPQ